MVETFFGAEPVAVLRPRDPAAQRR